MYEFRWSRFVTKSLHHWLNHAACPFLLRLDFIGRFLCSYDFLFFGRYDGDFLSITYPFFTDSLPWNLTFYIEFGNVRTYKVMINGSFEVAFWAFCFDFYSLPMFRNNTFFAYTFQSYLTFFTWSLRYKLNASNWIHVLYTDTSVDIIRNSVYCSISRYGLGICELGATLDTFSLDLPQIIAKLVRWR